VENVSFLRAKVRLLDSKYSAGRVRARIHLTMAAESRLKEGKPCVQGDDFAINQYHPFYKWKKGTIVCDVYCIAVEVKGGVSYLELSNISPESQASYSGELPRFIESEHNVKIGQNVSCVVTSILPRNHGVKVQISPGVQAFIPGLELDDNVEKINNMVQYFHVGSRIHCTVVKEASKGTNVEENAKSKTKVQHMLHLSAIHYQKKTKKTKPTRGELTMGRINTKISSSRPPALMIDIPGGYTGRCCITELNEVDDWENMPLGKHLYTQHQNKEDGDKDELNDDESAAESKEEEESLNDR